MHVADYVCCTLVLSIAYTLVFTFLLVLENVFICEFYYKSSMDAITNFDSYAWIAAGLFVIGLFGIMIYEKSSSKFKRYHTQQGTASDIE